MSFTSSVFLLIFFPVCIGVNCMIKERWRNGFLCLMSMLFYAWCGIKFFLLMMVSASLAYGFGLWIEKEELGKARRRILLLALGIHLGILFFYKYLFTLFPGWLDLWNGFWGKELLEGRSPAWVLPLGISFYTFSLLSYLLDIYWEKCRAQKKIVNVWLYVLFFPKVIQGPIMRYSAFEAQLSGRKIDLAQMNRGLTRLIKGMVKKVMIADRINGIVQYCFSDIGQRGTVTAWVGIIAYLLQLYYDFSGYSDMAVGLGCMAGFTIPENFDHPYLSASVGEYWRRWHISLGEWFRDYVYMPVSRFLIDRTWMDKLKNCLPDHSVLKNSMLLCDLFSLSAVWALTGIWHGSGVKYFAWGMWYFAFIAAERIRDACRKKRRKQRREKGKKLTPAQKVGDRLLVAAAVIFGQVIFRVPSLSDAGRYWKRLVCWTVGDGWYVLHTLTNYRLFALGIGILFCFPVYPYLEKRILGKNAAAELLYQMGLLLAACTAFCYAVGAGYSAFLYEVF